MKRIQWFVYCIIIVSILSACKSVNNGQDRSDVTVDSSSFVDMSMHEVDLTYDEEPVFLGRNFELYEDDEYRITIQDIDSTMYNQAKALYYKTPDSVAVIRSLDSIVDAISAVGSLMKIGQLDDDEFAYLKSIRFANGDSINYNEEGFVYDTWIVAYYPQYGMLEMEGGHSTVFGVNVLNGKSMLEDGNPGTQAISPNKKFRFSDIYGGQECCAFVFQKIVNGNLIKLFDFDDFGILCSVYESFWADDYTLYCDSYYRRHKLMIEQIQQKSQD